MDEGRVTREMIAIHSMSELLERILELQCSKVQSTYSMGSGLGGKYNWALLACDYIESL